MSTSEIIDTVHYQTSLCLISVPLCILLLNKVLMCLLNIFSITHNKCAG